MRDLLPEEDPFKEEDVVVIKRPKSNQFLTPTTSTASDLGESGAVRPKSGVKKAKLYAWLSLQSLPEVSFKGCMEERNERQFWYVMKNSCLLSNCHREGHKIVPIKGKGVSYWFAISQMKKSYRKHIFMFSWIRGCIFAGETSLIPIFLLENNENSMCWVESRFHHFDNWRNSHQYAYLNFISQWQSLYNSSFSECNVCEEYI